MSIGDCRLAIGWLTIDDWLIGDFGIDDWGIPAIVED
jgi:hypothetical protein